MNTNNSKFVGVKTLTVGNMGLDKVTLRKIAEKSKNKNVPVARFIGQINSMKSGATDMGEYVKFSGLVQGVNYATGEEYRSGTLIMPEVASKMLEGLLATTQANASENTPVAVVFAYEVTVKYDKDSATEYAYSFTSLTDGEDPLAELIAKLPPIPKVKLLS